MSHKVQAKRERRERAHLRARKRVVGTPERPRLAVYRSLRYLYAQLVDDTQGVTLAQANSSEDGVRSGLEGSTKCVEAAKAVGKLIAERAMAKGFDQVVFDRGGFIYHGRVKAVAEGAREQGLKF
jgi:large subunit ribosomal protein L18